MSNFPNFEREAQMQQQKHLQNYCHDFMTKYIYVVHADFTGNSLSFCGFSLNLQNQILKVCGMHVSS